MMHKTACTLSLKDNSICSLNEKITDKELCQSVKKIGTNRINNLRSLSTRVKYELKHHAQTILFNESEYEHNDDALLFDVLGYDEQTYGIQTGNLVGIVADGDVCVSISSRFGDAFLQTMLAETHGFTVTEIEAGFDAKGDMHWALAYLWMQQLKHAFRLGLPKTYVQRIEKLTSVKGRIDPLDYHLNSKTGRYLCDYREHSYESDALTLFIEAYKHLIKGKFNFLSQVNSIVGGMKIANNGRTRKFTDLMKTPHYSNPFYADYNRLIDLSKQVLLQDGISFSSSVPWKAFLFDISMLFEYFIRKKIKRYLLGSQLRLLDKNDHVLKINTCGSNKERKLLPDIVIVNDATQCVYIFDVKYKRFDHVYGIKREDLFQMHTYVGQYANDYSVKACGFIFPSREQKKKSPAKICINKLEIQLAVLFWDVSAENNDDEFCNSLFNDISEA